MKNIKFIAILSTLFLYVSCNSDPDISCKPENITKLMSWAEDFVYNQTKGDPKSQHLKFSKFNYIKKSCRLNKRKKTVRFKVSTSATDKLKESKVKFDCGYGHIRKSQTMRINCQLTF